MKSLMSLFFFNYGVDTVAFYNLMVRNNINLRVSCIEEGILSYNSQFDNDHGKIAEIHIIQEKY